MLPSGAILFPLGEGQCTSWAYFKRPDIYNNRSPADPILNWDADTWVGHAEAEGLVVDGNSRVGDIVAWPQSFGPPGHVAYVEAVEASGAITISEMNTSGLPTEDYHQDSEGHTYEVETISGSGFQFIHSR
jgi:surface antigen